MAAGARCGDHQKEGRARGCAARVQEAAEAGRRRHPDYADGGQRRLNQPPTDHPLPISAVELADARDGTARARGKPLLLRARRRPVRRSPDLSQHARDAPLPAVDRRHRAFRSHLRGAALPHSIGIDGENIAGRRLSAGEQVRSRTAGPLGMALALSPDPPRRYCRLSFPARSIRTCGQARGRAAGRSGAAGQWHCLRQRTEAE